MAKRNLRLRLGPGGFIYVVVAPLILLLAVLTQANLMFWAFGLLVGGLVVSVAMSLHVLRAVTVHRLLPTHGVAGEAMVLRYRITNTKSWMPVFNLIITETWGKKQNGWKKIGPVADPPPRLAGRPYGWVMHLGPKQSVQAEVPCWPSRRGVLHFERIELTTSFPFGVIRCALVVDHVGEVLIFPHLYRINRRLIHRMHQIDIGGVDRRERPSDTGEFFGLRSYRPGDSLKMIDWKHSARTGRARTDLLRIWPRRRHIALTR